MGNSIKEVNNTLQDIASEPSITISTSNKNNLDKKIQDFSKIQLDSGNSDFINDGIYDDVNDYIHKLL